MSSMCMTFSKCDSRERCADRWSRQQATTCTTRMLEHRSVLVMSAKPLTSHHSFCASHSLTFICYTGS